MQPQIYDSGDPNLPNLPDTDQIQWSDYDNYLSNRPSSSSSSASDLEEEDPNEEHNTNHNSNHEIRRRRTSTNHSTLKKSRRSSMNSKKSVKSSNSKKPLINIFGTNNEFLDSNSDDVVSENEKIQHTNDYSNNNQNQHKRKKSYNSNNSINSNNSSQSDHSIDNTKHRERSGSFFSILHLPRLIHRFSDKSGNSNDGINSNDHQFFNRSQNNLTRANTEIHAGRSNSVIDNNFNNSPIIQPTRAHSIAAGATFHNNNDNNNETQSFSHLPPSNFYDEETGRPDLDLFKDRDVQYDDVRYDDSSNSDNIIGSNSDALKSDNSNLYNNDSNNKDEEEDDEIDANLSDIEDNGEDNDGDDGVSIDNINSYNPLEKYATNILVQNKDYNDKIKRINSRISNHSIKSNNNNKNNTVTKNKVEIDQSKKKIMKTDTDDESVLNIPSKSQYQPESILKKKNEKTIENEEINNDDDNNNNNNSSDNIAVTKSTQPHKSRKKKAARRRRRKSRKYVGSQSKKERTAWEPGIDLRTTNVFLNSPGSIITITDYSKSRYRISHYNLYSEMNPKFSKFTSDDTILSAHDFDEEYDTSNPEFNDFIDYMNKVTDSHKSVEDAINDKPLWSQVRWININGLSWEAISIIGKKYNLHPLSVEDLVDIPQRTKMDIYQQHLFVVMPLMKLLKVKRLSDDTNETYMQRLRRHIRELGNGDSISRSPTYISKSNHKSKNKVKNNSNSFNDNNRKKMDNLDRTNTQSKIITKTIATREQLSREFSNNSVKSTDQNPNILQVPGQNQSNNNDNNNNNISRILSDSMVSNDNKNNNKGTNNYYSDDGNDQLDRTRSVFNDNILPRSTNTFKKRNIYSTEEEYKFEVEIEKSSRGRKLTDLTFITPTSAKYKSRMATINRMRPLMSKSLAVGIEQVSIYLTVDGTVLSFFEHSAMDIERAILSRLSAEYTILRETCNPSILFHSVLDANVDLLYPVITAYSRILNEKELEILTASLPDLQHTQELHLMLNELAILKNSILPISSLITQLKDLSTDSSSTFIDESCKLYLADISDHLLAFIDEIDSMSSTIENLIDLIFNTLSVETNNSMQQLSLVSVLFLPLTFWAGYFGMNFKSFGNLDFNVSFFWKLAIPFTAGMMILLMKNSCWRILLKVKRFFLYYWNKFQTFRNSDEKVEEFDRRFHNFNPEKWASFRRKIRKRE